MYLTAYPIFYSVRSSLVRKLKSTVESDLTDAGGWVRLPEKSAVELNASDFRHSLNLVPRVTLKGNGVARLPAVSVACPILRGPWVVAGRGNCSWNKNIHFESAVVQWDIRESGKSLIHEKTDLCSWLNMPSCTATHICDGVKLINSCLWRF